MIQHQLPPSERRRRPRVIAAAGAGVIEDFLGPDQLARIAMVADYDPGLVLSEFESAQARAALARAEILLTCWGAPPVTAQVLAGAPRLRAIVHAAGTVKGMVTEACRRRGLIISSAAEANAVPVAEYTLAMIIAANKGLFGIARGYRIKRSAWTADDLPADIGNHGRTVGIVGASRVGRRLLSLLGVLDLQVLLYDPYVSSEVAADGFGATSVGLDELCRRSDVVSLHAPSLPETRAMIGPAQLAQMRTGATLINTARGALVDLPALTTELRAGRLNAVLDVTEPERLPDDSPLYDLPNVILTPHIAGSAGTELHRLGDAATAEITRFAAGEDFAHPVRYEELGRIA